MSKKAGPDLTKSVMAAAVAAGVGRGRGAEGEAGQRARDCGREERCGDAPSNGRQRDELAFRVRNGGADCGVCARVCCYSSSPLQVHRQAAGE